MEYLALKAPVDIAYLGSRMVEKGYNRSTLARKIGVNRNTIRRWLNGEVRYALMKNILRELVRRRREFKWNWPYPF